MKHFTKVGFAGRDRKPIPRWAVDQSNLNRVMQHQNADQSLAAQIFGKVGRNVVQELKISEQLAEFRDFMSSENY